MLTLHLVVSHHSISSSVALALFVYEFVKCLIFNLHYIVSAKTTSRQFKFTINLSTVEVEFQHLDHGKFLAKHTHSNRFGAQLSTKYIYVRNVYEHSTFCVAGATV